MEKTIRLATHYCKTRRCDAPGPMHKAPQHMQNTIAQHKQRREKVTWNPQLHCARRSRFHAKATTRKTVALASLLFSATKPPFTRKNTMFRANPSVSKGTWSWREKKQRTAVLPAFATPCCIPVARTAVQLACSCSFGLSGSRTQRRLRLGCLRALLTDGCS